MPIAAVSVGMVKGQILVDLDYAEDSAAEVDMNLIATVQGKLVELKGTAEQKTFDRRQLDGSMLDAGLAAVRRLVEIQKIEATELRSLRSAASRASCCRSARFSSARSVRVLSDARSAPNRASTRDIALPGLARRWAIVQSLGQDFGKRQAYLTYDLER